ncbi:MAG TPA: AraD1 family protein [Burkholderiales bacterium]|nr:AraD1 family protein [Burkholderiales bacterium]
MRLVQYRNAFGQRCVGVPSDDGKHVQAVADTQSVYALARAALASNSSLERLVRDRMSTQQESYEQIVRERRLLPPLDHPDAARWLVTGTGLSHLGSAAARDSMHAKLQQDETQLTDSMKIFKWGLEGGKPEPGKIGVQPEWFYKGDGRCVVAPEQPLELPAYALDGGDEVEVVGLYVIADDGTPWRVGFALGNEYADHVMERQNYLYLAHSKLRQCSYGPEILLGALPRNVTGTARLLRGSEAIWSEGWLSGDDNMAHSIANLEHHHFKYADFRRPGDVHVHFFGAATGSFTKNVKANVGDVFEIESPVFGRPLRNPLGPAKESVRLFEIKSL